jgi:hypothetical protein
LGEASVKSAEQDGRIVVAATDACGCAVLFEKAGARR